MRQVSVLFINMVLPAKGSCHSWALQKAFEVIHESARRLRGKVYNGIFRQRHVNVFKEEAKLIWREISLRMREKKLENGDAIIYFTIWKP